MGKEDILANGLFIVLEGIEGSGKSSQVRLLADYLAKEGYPVVTTQEPGGTRIGEVIRDVLLDLKHQIMDGKTELLLYAASRSQHIKEVIAPALKEGKIVICDRFSLSTFAYQGFGRGIDQGEIRQVEAFATGGLEPDFTVIFDVPVEVGLKRATKHYTDRIEQEDISFHQRVRDGYLQLARQNPGSIRVVDGAKSKEEIHQELVGIVEELLQDAKT